MDVTFATKKLQKTCNSETALRGEFGPAMAKKIQTRLGQLAAADTLAVMKLLPGRCHELTEDWAGHLALDLVHPKRLIFRPNHDPLPATDEGSLVWKLVTDVTVVEIADYH